MMSLRKNRFGAATLATLVAGVIIGSALVLPRADAAFPGQNGKIVFDSRRDSNDEIYVMNADGSGQTRLTNTPEDSDVTPSFSADGNKILFASDRDAALYEIYVMNADGSSPTALNSVGSSPAFSPDGQKVVFHSARDDFSSAFEIYVMNADGTVQTRLTDSTGNDVTPSFSPDGQRIVFSSERSQDAAGFDPETDPSEGIYVMDADGGSPTLVTDAPGFHSNPSFSPDGAQIAFDSIRDGSQRDVYVINTDGSGEQRLTTDSKDDIRPAFSPDGQQIAFNSSRPSGGFNYAVYVMTAAGSQQMPVTGRATNNGPNWGPEVAIDPDPDPEPDPEGDDTVDGVGVDVKKKQKLKGKALKIKTKVGSQTEAVTAIATGKVEIKNSDNKRVAAIAKKSKAIKLGSAAAAVAIGGSEVLVQKPKGSKKKAKKAAKKIKKALKQDKRVTAQITITVTDAAGNELEDNRVVRIV